MSNSAPISLQQLFRFYRGLPHQTAALVMLEEDLRKNPYDVVMRRDRPWFLVWSQAGKQPDAPERDVILIQRFEQCRLTSYPDPKTGGAPWTIGWGNTRMDGKPVQPGQTITQVKADQMFYEEVLSVRSKLAKTIPGWENLKKHQQEALTSFAYNCGEDFYGAEGFDTITKVLREGRLNDVPAAINLYVDPGTSVEKGLRNRRAAEGELWRGTPLPPPHTITVPTQQDAAPGLTERRQWITQIKALNLSQPDASTCQSACIGMAVGSKDIAGIRRKLLAKGDAGDPGVMAAVIREYGRPYRYEANASLEKCYSWLKSGEFLITHGWFTGSGHVICLDGLKATSPDGRYAFDVKDPYSEFNAKTWKYDLGSKFFDGFYSDLLIYATCVAGTSASSARDIYNRGKVNPSQGGMWVHRFMTAAWKA